MHYVYVLRSGKDNNLYTGYTADLRQRHATHRAGKVASTRNRRPLQLIYYEAYVLAKDAKARELFLKSGSGKRFIRKLAPIHDTRTDCHRIKRWPGAAKT